MRRYKEVVEMSIHRAKAKEGRDGWYIRCPVCRTRIELVECPIPGGMNNNIETCFECGADIEVQPSSEDNKTFLC
jgi:hypothetical protein